MKITRTGELLLKSSLNLIQSWDQLLRSVHAESHEPAGIIKLGCHSAVAQFTLSKFLGEFLHQFSNIEFQLVHGLSRQMTEQVVSSQIDIAITVNPLPHPDLVIKEIYRDEVSLWQAQKCVNLDVLITEPNLLQTQDIISKMNKRGFKFNRTIESTSLEVIANLVSHGVGCGILPERVLQSFEVRKYQQVKDSPVFNDRICLVYKTEFRKTERGRVLIDFILKKLI